MPVYQLSLDNLIKKQATYEVNVSLSKKLTILKGIVEGVGFLRSKNVLHRDLKPANIMLNKALVPKIIDLGSGCLAYPSRNEVHTARTFSTKVVFST
jgi:serine/threonine protein kinase